MVENNDILTEEQGAASPEKVAMNDGEAAPGARSDEVNDASGVDEPISEVIDEVNAAEDREQGIGPETSTPGESFKADVAVDANSLSEGFSRGSLDLLMDVNITLRVELGRTRKTIAEILKLSPGMLVELDRSSGDDIDIYVNDKLLASGEVTVVDGHFAIKITRILSKAERIRSMM